MHLTNFHSSYCIVSIYSNFGMKTLLESKLGLYSEQILTEISKNIKNELAKYEVLSEEAIMDDYVQEGLLKFQSKWVISGKMVFLIALNTNLGNEIFRFNNLKNIHIMMPDGGYFYDLGYEFFNESEKKRILNAIDESKSNIFYTYSKTNQGSDCILIGRKINSKDNPDKKIGYLLIVVDEKVFADQIYKNIDMGKGSDLFLIDTGGLIISSISKDITNGSHFSGDGFVNRLKKSRDAGEYTVLQKLKAENLLAVSSYIPEAGWFLVGRIPNSYINSESIEIRNGVLLVCLIVAVISIILSMFIYLSVYSPIKDIVVSARQIGNGELDVVINDDNNDEMGSLSKNIKQMVRKLKELIENVKKEQTAKRDAELKMLQAQINPHFLFNTLNSLKWTAMLSNNNTLHDGLEALSGLMKDTILNKDEFVNLETEMNNLNNYTTIQRLRYGCSFELIFDIDEELKKSRVLKFLLQPIVENCIIHGIEDEETLIEIKVSAARKGSYLFITIDDNGKGFDMAETDFDKKNKKLSGIGITNVDERIKINYGEEFGLKLNSKPGLGTNVSIKLPFINEGEKNV